MTRAMDTRLGEGTWQTQTQDPLPATSTSTSASSSSLRHHALRSVLPETDIWKRNWPPSEHPSTERPPLRRATVSHGGSSSHSIPTPPSSQPPSPPSPSRKPPSSSSSNPSRRSSDLSPITSLPPEIASFLAPHLTEARRYWDAQSNTLHWSFDRLEMLLGYTPNQVSNSTAWWSDRIHPNDKGKVLASLQAFHDSETTPFWTHEYRILASDDTYMLVTDQIRALERAPRTGSLLRSVGVLFSNAQQQMVLTHLHSSSQDTVSEPNPRPPDEPIRISMTHSPPLISRWPDPTPSPITQPTSSTSNSQQRQPYSRALSPITPANDAPESDTAALLRTVTDNSTSGLFLTDSNGHATYMNRAAQEITGWTLEDLRGQPLHNSLHCLRADGSAYPISECSIGKTYTANVPIRNQADMFVHRDGHLFPVVWSVAPLAGKGKELGVVIDFRDVTGERKMEEEKLRLHVEAEAERTKMAESESHRVKLAEFVDFVCHEIRNPLHGIAASAEFLADCMSKIERELDSPTSLKTTRPALHNSYSLPVTPYPFSPPSPDNSMHKRSHTTGPVSSPSISSRTRETRDLLAEMQLYVRSIRECCSHQAVITNNVLDLSRLESGKVELLSEIFDPSEVAARCLAMLSARIAEKNISARLEVPEKGFVVKGDPMRYSQVVMNLAGNAVKFTESGKEITIVVSPPPAEDERNGSSRIVFSSAVRDTGIGMTPEEVSSLFVRFGQLNKRISRDYGGSGLGLNISNELVHLLGGEFEVESEKGRGTMMRFSVRMKRVGEQEESEWREKRERIRREEEEAARVKEEMEKQAAASVDGEVVRIEDLALPEIPMSPSQADARTSEAAVSVVAIPRPTAPVAGTSTSSPPLGGPSQTSKSSEPEVGNSIPPMVKPSVQSLVPAAPSPSLLASPDIARLVPKFSHVLIAEDNVINQMVLATYLKKLGYEHTVCSNGREAVEHFMAGKGDVIIMDIEMPVMDGREATRLIRAHEDSQAATLPPSAASRPRMKRMPSTCIIALSGNARPGLMQDAYDTGLNDYLTKPCSMDELARMLTKWEHDRARRIAAVRAEAEGDTLPRN